MKATPMWVKICGNTNLEDAAHAAEAGADAVGFVFAASRRQVTAAEVASITVHLPASVERVGVFETRDALEIATIARESGLTAVQLHGGLDEALLQKLGDQLAGVQIIQTLHWDVNSAVAADESIALLTERLEQIARLGTVSRVLIDSRVGSVGGGTGVAYDWSTVSTAFAAAPVQLSMIAAGGLTPGNVAKAIAELRPWGVDVVSGVERSPGRKDPALVEAFIKNARGI
jgi:phosphoribosylanthranilate isomerase